MEIFLELLLTIALSLLLSIVLALLLSLASAGEIKRASTVRSRRDSTGKSVTPQPKLEVEPKSRGCESERKIGFVEKADEYKTEPVRGFVSEGCESPTKDVGGANVVELGEKPIGEISVENLVDGSRKREKLCGIDFDEDGDVGVRDRLLDLDDDWEGVERTELEKVFGAAVAFVGASYNADRVSSLGSDVKMRLYGLHKIATQGPCHEPQPMPFKLSARAKWNAWQRLGNMTSEVAMEQYITLLSRRIPELMGDNKQVSEELEAFRKLASNLKASPPNQPGAVDERKMETKPRVEGLDVTGFRVQTP
ncbi:acyl-CoA-binding domain-containing protein 3-like [Alnus glutinosa]|uniref:acyl-CoA-binding domain-containing protein 3-like n=1 Tax=Alnus glutinosa TaxID=3517 RepID=UPI002D78BBF1|nr:acyl-CoA-binding domain-containing protein 3-like [Alnus glutinosa]